MSDITWLRTENNEGWTAIAYDLHTHYGYKTMLCLLDSFISNFHVRVERIAKAKITGQTHTVVWQKLLFNKAKALTEMQALQEECGEVAIGCKVKVPEESFTQQVQDQVDSIVEFFHNTLESNC